MTMNFEAGLRLPLLSAFAGPTGLHLRLSEPAGAAVAFDWRFGRLAEGHLVLPAGTRDAVLPLPEGTAPESLQVESLEIANLTGARAAPGLVADLTAADPEPEAPEMIAFERATAPAASDPATSGPAADGASASDADPAVSGPPEAPGDPIMTISSARAGEGDFITFTLTLSGPASDAVSVDYRTLSGTALTGTDVIVFNSDQLAGTVTFGIGETVKTITLRIASENLDELDESFFVELSNPQGAEFSDGAQSIQGIGWALDDDGPGLNRTIAISSPTVVEGAGNRLAFTISLSEAFGATTQFAFSTYDGSARAGTDYVATSGNVSFAPGQTETIVYVTVMNNAVVEMGESFGLAISGANGVAGAAGEGRILDDDGPVPVLSIEGVAQTEGGYATFTVRLSEPATDAVTVAYNTVSGTALTGTDVIVVFSDQLAGTVTFGIGETVKTITLRIASENLDEIDESFFVELSNATGATFGPGIHSLQAIGWALDDDGPGNDRSLAISNPVAVEGAGNVLVFTVGLSEAFAVDTTFSYTTTNGSARAGFDYVAQSGTLTFRAGQTETQVVVTVANDAVIESAESLGLVVTGANGVAGAAGEGRILNDDGPLPTLSIEGVAQTEGGYATFTVRLSEPATDAVTVAYNTVSGTALTGTDVIVVFSDQLAGTVTFGIGETVKTITLRIASENLDEIDESFFVELSDPVGATFGGNVTKLQAIGWALDNDGPGLNRTATISNPTVEEGPGAQAVFVIELSSPSTSAITLNYQTVAETATAGQDFVARSGSVTFAAGQTRAYVTVPLLSDLGIEAAETFRLDVLQPYPAGIAGATISISGRATLQDYAVRGTPNADVLVGSNLAERIEAYGGDDSLDGLYGDDILYGGDGNDFLQGGAGGDRMFGGLGDDLFIVDNPRDRTFDDGGTDTVFSRISLTLLGGIENLTMAGNTARVGTGNFSNNRIVANALDNVLYGGAGNDVMFGGAGNDVIFGGTGNDYIDGGSGRDRMLGGAGNDTYVIDDVSDRALESAGEGTDSVISSISQILSNAVENLTLTGTASIFGAGNGLGNTMTGNSGNNILWGYGADDDLSGGAGADLIFGGSGNDRLDGGLGVDRLRGGSGDDTYLIDNAGDRALEVVGEGTDTVFSSVSMTLGIAVENLVFTGAAALTGVGTGDANTITGNAGANVLWGLGGDDEIRGGGGADKIRGNLGADLLFGGLGADDFQFLDTADSGPGAARDRIGDFQRNVDKIVLTTIDANELVAGNQRFTLDVGGAFAAGEIRQSLYGANLLLEMNVDGDAAAEMSILLLGVGGTLTSSDFLF